MGQTYQIQFFNKSRNGIPTPHWGIMRIPQLSILPDTTAMPGAIPAVFCAQAIPMMGMMFPGHPTASLQWTENYSFISGCGAMTSGVPVQCFQSFSADLSTNNVLELSNPGIWYSVSPVYQSFNQYTDTPGSMTITLSGGSGNGLGAGIGLSGTPLFMVPAPGGTSTYKFTPNHSYWLTFNFNQGLLIDPSQISQKVQVNFPPGVYTMYVTLEANNTFTVSETAPPVPANPFI